jgi:hypothetical protein
MPQRGLGSASAAVRPYFLDETRPLSVGTSSVTVAGSPALGTHRASLLFFRTSSVTASGGVREEFALNPSALASPNPTGFHLLEPECCTSTTL